MTIVLDGDLKQDGCHPAVLHLATEVEAFAVEHGLPNLRTMYDGAAGMFFIEVENGLDITTTIKEFDL